jgi:hypothetical protein
MGETLTEQRRVRDGALRGVKRCDGTGTAAGGNAGGLTAPLESNC